MIPSSALFDQSTIAALLDHDPWSPIIAPSSRCSIGRWSSAGRRSGPPVDGRLIRNVPTLKPFSCAFGKAWSTPRNCAAFCSVTLCLSLN